MHRWFAIIVCAWVVCNGSTLVNQSLDIIGDFSGASLEFVTLNQLASLRMVTNMIIVVQ